MVYDVCRKEVQACVEDSEKMILLEQRDKQIVELQHLLANIQEDRELVTAQLRYVDFKLKMCRI